MKIISWLVVVLLGSCLLTSWLCIQYLVRMVQVVQEFFVFAPQKMTEKKVQNTHIL